MGVLVTRKGKKKESSAPVLNILEATVKVNSAEYLAAGDTVTKRDGSTFTVEKPHISCELEVVDTGPAKKGDIGTTWYEKFYYPETEKGSGEYENRPGTKVGGLSEARYGPGFWESDQVLKAEDLEGFMFVARLKPKTEFGGTKITGTCVDHDTIQALPSRDDGSEASRIKEAISDLSDKDVAEMHAALSDNS
jgi:hypothetical protein